MGNEQSASEEPSQVKRRRAEPVGGAKPRKFPFLISQTEKIPEKHENGSVSGLPELSGESSVISESLGC